jgi:hypothetical protein
MILLDLYSINDNIKDGDEIKFNFINNYKPYIYLNNSENNLFQQSINSKSMIEKSVKFIKFLGEGSYGKVYKIKINDNTYALKINENENPLKLFDRYNSIVSNKNLEKYVIKLYCAGEIKSGSKYSYYSIMEYGGKSIRNIVDKVNMGDLQIILKQLFNIVYISCKYRILFTDFKLSNLTFSSDKRVKIIDLYMYCESYSPCKQCKIVKTYSSLEIEKEKRIYENSDYNYSCIFIPFAVCLIDLICVDSLSHYCSKLAKKYDLDLNIKQIIPLLQISCYNYTNNTNEPIKNYKNLLKQKKKFEEEFPSIKKDSFFEYFVNLLTPKKEFSDFISKKRLILIISKLIIVDPEQRSLSFLKEKLV